MDYPSYQEEDRMMTEERESQGFQGAEDFGTNSQRRSKEYKFSDKATVIYVLLMRKKAVK